MLLSRIELQESYIRMSSMKKAVWGKCQQNSCSLEANEKLSVHGAVSGDHHCLERAPSLYCYHEGVSISALRALLNITGAIR
jgi:hypothetical protein